MGSDELRRGGAVVECGLAGRPRSGLATLELLLSYIDCCGKRRTARRLDASHFRLAGRRVLVVII